MHYKHNKKRNSAFLYEALVREATKAALSDDRKNAFQNIVGLIKERFANGTLLGKDLKYYQSLLPSETSLPAEDAEEIIKRVKERRSSEIDQAKLFKEQSRLLTTIQAMSLSPGVFSNTVPYYKDLATVSQIFSDKVDVREQVLLEKQYAKRLGEKQSCGQQENKEELDSLSYGLYLRKFNETYSEVLNESQRKLLSHYIVSTTPEGNSEMYLYINEELGRIKEEINKNLANKDVSSDNDLVDGLKGVQALLETYRSSPQDYNSPDTIEEIMNMQELIEELNS